MYIFHSLFHKNCRLYAWWGAVVKLCQCRLSSHIQIGVTQDVDIGTCTENGLGGPATPVQSSYHHADG